MDDRFLLWKWQGVGCVFFYPKHASTSGGGECVSKQLKLNSTRVGGNCIREKGIIVMQNGNPGIGIVNIPSIEFVQDAVVEVLFVPGFD